MQIIAECGVNYDDLDQALRMVGYSNWAGADYAKFQLYDESVIKDHPLRDELAKRMLSREDAQALFDHGKSIGQQVFFTPMFPDAVDWIEEMGCDLIKIRCADSKYAQLVHIALGVGVPVLISTDNHYIGVHWSIPQVKLLYCVPKYPASPDDYDFIPQHFTTGAYPGAPVFAGVSDHSKGLEVMERAKECGAEFCECHVMIEGTHPIEEAWSKTFEEVRAFLQ